MRALLLGLFLAPTVLASVAYGAGDPTADGARRSAVVAKVGARVITAGELEDRLAAVPRFQLATFGDTPAAIRRRFLDEILVPDALYAAGAEQRHLENDLPTANILVRVRSNAALRAVRNDVGPATAISMDDVKRYYEDNKSHYDSPERYAVWRILCKTREEAVAVLEAAKKDPTPQNFGKLARDHSIDAATSQRGGNIGFLTLDGTSNEPGLKVDPLVVKAAASVKDGELVPAPVAELGNFAVVWHRGTVPASHRTVEESAAQIRDAMWKERVEKASRKLIDDLRARDLKELNDSLVDGIEISASDGEVVPRHRPGQVSPRAPSGATIPR